MGINAFNLQTEEQKEHFFKTFDRRRWRYLRAYQSQFRNALIKQMQPVLDNLDSLSGAMAMVDVIQPKPIKDTFYSLYTTVGGYYASNVFEGLKSHFSFQTKESHEDQFARRMRQWVDLKGADLVVNITDNTKSQLRTILNRGIEEGLGTDEIARIIRDSGNIGGLKRGKVIARTEIIRASNLGSIEGARNTNLELQKEWISTRDGRTRETHAILDGQVVGLDKPFNVGGFDADYPGSPNLPAEESINCRCTQAYIPV